MRTMREIAAEWAAEKEVERMAVEHRRRLEDEMVQVLSLVPDLDSTVSKEVDGYVIKITGRIDRKVDADKIQELAAQHGLESHLSTICRWKPELNLTVWKATDPSITKLLAPAITAKPGRPSFSITNKEAT
ncbi:hypothetical protein UFOVP764_38 [uncultured Caudovirales phage]|uniref:Uncharacterized protein n=1 Tax=uncultured Caudovirales phage TaxID=2100421 RepID=A0A6J5NVU3_9CAUD|nr:hypothetical protein UFOVP764_38 [uncultured Caudovirales phage]